MPNPARSRGRQVNAFQALALLLSFVLVAGIGGVLAAGLALPGVALANGATDVTAQAFNGLPTELDQPGLPEKSNILASDGTLLATFYDQNRVVVPLADISPLLQHAVIATEDKRFYEHAGVDPAGMLRAFIRNQSGGAQQGASTLTQQYVKNVLIEAALAKDEGPARQAALEEARGTTGSEGIARKLREAKLAITLEKQFTKDQILEKYLNIAQFGIKVYGAESAAQYYFSKPAKDLTYLEAATIAGVTQSPTKWDPVKNPAASERRRNIVLKLMDEQHYITDAEYTTGIATPLASTLKPQELKQGCAVASTVVAGSGYFCDYVTKVIVNDPTFGKTKAERQARLYKGGLTITTTLDPKLQAEADTEVKAGIPVHDPSGVASAIVTVQPGTGKIIAMAQNRDYAPVGDAAARTEPVNFNTDSDYGGSGGFAPGSTFKPFTLLEWLKQGHSLADQVNGSVRPLNTNMFTTCGVKGINSSYTPGNAEPGSGMMSVLDATKNSVNLAYLTMGTQLDMCNIMQGAIDLGMHTASPWTTTQTGRPLGSTDPGLNPSNIIGTDSVAPLSMAASFAAFASGGTYCTPIAIVSVVDTDGKQLAVPPANCQAKLDPKYANTINYALSNVWKGTAKSVGAPPFPAAGKTGTTSRNQDTWFVGYTPLLSTAVWVGYSNQTKQVIGPINGSARGPIFGATIAGPTWKRFMVEALNGVANPGFAAPDQKLVVGEKIPIPSVIGRSEADAKKILTTAGFTPATAPAQVPSTLPAGSVVSQDPSGSATRGTRVTLTLSNGQAPPPDPSTVVPAPGPGQGQGPGQGPGQGQGPPGKKNP
ncbi:penicillin-binding protein [Cellulomonas sp. McL0617]|uniref:penicillin-binding protein n=1 Tax=Cellulomonas sp. McL0617 TaxID=3415675 RepID=UPI003CFB7C5F